MRRNYFLGGIVGKVVGAVAGKAIGSFFGDGGGGGTTGGGGSTKLQAASFLEQSSQEAQRDFKEGQQRRDQENPVENLIAKLLNAYEKPEDLNKYWNA
jgi:uncharacterized protein YcfJ